MGRKARLKRERRNKARVGGGHREEILRRLSATGLAPTLVEEPTDERKVSDALLELIQPFVRSLAPHERSQARLEQLVTFGALAWNATLLPGGDLFLGQSLASLGLDEEGDQVARELVAALTERRQRLFPNDRRFIVDTVATVAADGELTVSAAHAQLPRTLPSTSE
jgi:hypothetical protein